MRYNPLDWLSHAAEGMDAVASRTTESLLGRCQIIELASAVFPLPPERAVVKPQRDSQSAIVNLKSG